MLATEVPSSLLDLYTRIGFASLSALYGSSFTAQTWFSDFNHVHTEVQNELQTLTQQVLSFVADAPTSLQLPITGFPSATGPVSANIPTFTLPGTLTAMNSGQSTSGGFLPSTATVGTSSNTIGIATSAASASNQQSGVTQSVGFETGIGVAVGVIGLAVLAFLGFYIFQMGYRRHKREVFLESGVESAILLRASRDRQTDGLNQTGVAQELDARRRTELEG